MKSATKHLLCLCVLVWNCQHSSALATIVLDNDIQYPLYISAAVVITNCAWFIVLAEIVPGVNKPARENHQSPTNHTKVKKPWRYTSISPVYISLNTATRIKTFAVVRQVVMNFAHRWQNLRVLYKLPTIVHR